jgi:uncharacterized repeat protein (TIGR03803 family)
MRGYVNALIELRRFHVVSFADSVRDTGENPSTKAGEIEMMNAVLTGSVALVAAVMTGAYVQAATLKTIHSFCSETNCAYGEVSYGAMVQGIDGNLYGTANGAGANGYGTVFKISTAGKMSAVYNFCSLTNCADGDKPVSGLLLALNGDFYGTTYGGGANGAGTVFKLTAGGVLTTLHSFDISDGEYPNGLIQGAHGNFYGTTQYGGTNGVGTIFKITPGGTLTTLYSFCSQTDCTDGSYPNGVTLGAHGILYGTTYLGGANNYGSVFEFTAEDTLNTLHGFDDTDGKYPGAGLTRGGNGDFYGTVPEGGANGWGTVFKITPGGTLTTLHNFMETDGGEPQALMQATSGAFYGVTYLGGKNGDGTIFKISPAGKLATVHNFDDSDGARANTALAEDTNGDLYGTTTMGGARGVGTIYSLSVGFSEFVETQTTSGKAGAAVKILGTGLTGATDVTFNGIAAAFTVVSDSEISTTVPADATTGTVEVMTPAGTFKSNKKFAVIL